MIALSLGILGFALFFLYDVNQICWEKRALSALFPVGNVCLAAATALDLYDAVAGKTLSFCLPDLAALAGAVLFAALLFYTLFWALPFEDAYAYETEERKVYDKGMYALCRHPGVLWFFFLYLFLGIACFPGTMLRNGMIYSLLNLAYIIFQDYWTFPKMFPAYLSYKKQTPFLIPTFFSIKQAWKTRRFGNNSGKGQAS